MPKFVILRHEFSASNERSDHWDLMLEDDNALLTWSLESLPNAQSAVVGTILPEHRKVYLSYEGPISEDRGTVSRWDSGEFSWISRQSVLAVRLRGKRLCGELRILPESDGEHYRISFSPSSADAHDGLSS